MPRSAIVTIVSCSLLLALVAPVRAGVMNDPAGDSQAQARPGVHIPIPVPLEGVVVASQSFWEHDRIVTESIVRTAEGQEVRVQQPGGTVDGIGQIQFPSPALLATGDRVSLIMDGTRPDLAQPIVEVVSLFRATQGETKDDTAVVEKYVRTTNDFLVPLYWEKSCIEVTYHPDGTTHLDGELEFQIMDQVFDTWRSATQSCSYLTFSMQSRQALEAELDRMNVIIFREDVWGRPGCPEDPKRCHQTSAAAVTTVSYVNSEGKDRSGEIVDADIEMNALSFDIGYNGQSNSTNGCISDLANTLTHEVGHMMGLEHTCFISPPRDTQGNPKPFPQDDQGNEVGFCNPNDSPELQATTMYPTQDCGEVSKATPEADDIAAICGIYPLAQDPGECGPPGSLTRRACACDTGSRPDGGLAAGSLALFLLAGLYLYLGLWRRRRPNPSAQSAMNKNP